MKVFVWKVLSFWHTHFRNRTDEHHNPNQPPHTFRGTICVHPMHTAVNTILQKSIAFVTVVNHHVEGHWNYSKSLYFLTATLPRSINCVVSKFRSWRSPADWTHPHRNISRRHKLARVREVPLPSLLESQCLIGDARKKIITFVFVVRSLRTIDDEHSAL